MRNQQPGVYISEVPITTTYPVSDLAYLWIIKDINPIKKIVKDNPIPEKRIPDIII